VPTQNFMTAHLGSADPHPPALSARVAALAMLAGVLAGSLPAGTHAAAAGSPATRTVGSLTLHRCAQIEAWCGSMNRALDPTGVVSGSVPIYFEYYPHTAPGASHGLLVAAEGGPGFPTTESREAYRAFYGPLLHERDLLLMDYRGTGHSGAIDCKALREAPVLRVEDVGACGRFLGDKADLYSTAYAADDLAAILAALGARPIDLYGDSYGTYFSQVFAVRHPATLRSLILDGAYALDGPDYAWYPTYAPAMRAKFNTACRRDEECSRLPGESLDHMAPTLALLRHSPSQAQCMDADGKVKHFTANASMLATVMFASAPAFSSVRELDAATRSFAAGDRLPLLRLMAETLTFTDSRYPSPEPAQFSEALASAVTCQDEPQIFDMSLPPARRLVDLDRAIAERKRTAPDTYAPFTIDEYRGLPIDYSFIDMCVLWPLSPPAHPAGQVVSPTARYPDMPVLVISGELDNMTTMADGAAAAHRFSHARQLIVANSFHVNALPAARSNCAAQLARRFISTLDPGDTRCARSVPPVRLLAQFARQVRDVAPAQARAGNAASTLQLQAAATAILTAADAIGRLQDNTTGKGVGLRGGSFTVQSHAHRSVIALSDVRWSEDLAVSGTVDAREQQGLTSCELRLKGAENLSGTLHASWMEGAADAHADVSGVLGGAALRATMRAP
jgi:pimeloyl-ACP methyl ester carboxylesterase